MEPTKKSTLLNMARRLRDLTTSLLVTKALRKLRPGGQEDCISADKINLDFVLGNKVMVGSVNANREYFELGVRDMSQAELEYPGGLDKLLTDPVKGLDNYQELFKKLTLPNGASKVFCQVAES